MDKWEAVLEQFLTDGNAQLDVKGLIKILQTANVILDEDLAEFELEWIFKSLLYKPINLLHLIQTKQPYDIWSKPLGDTFKLLARSITKYGDALSSYYKPIVEICQLSFEPGTQKQALDCLACIAKRSSIAATNIQRYILALESSTTCKAPLALFIGSVCEHQPTTVENEVIRIWRIYLNLLECNKNKDTIVVAILQGILGLFKHFGQNLPIAELRDFYKKISVLLLESDKRNNAVLSMLEHYADLFRECIACDVKLRKWLWSKLNDACIAAVLLSVYDVVFVNFREKKKTLHLILTSEVIPRVGTSTLSTYTALRVRAHAQNKYGVRADVENLPVVESLEFELRSGTVSKDVADALAWSIECGLMNSDKLLQTSMMFHKNIPNSKLKDVIVYGTLKTTPEIRKASIIFLVTETCQDAASLDSYLPLWKLLFDSADGSDNLVLEGSKVIFEDFMDYTNYQLKTLVESEVEMIPEKVSNLLKLTAHVLAMLSPESYTEKRSALCYRLVSKCTLKWGICAATIACGRVLYEHGEEIHDEDSLYIFTMLTIGGCKDEALLCECCLLYIKEDTPAIEDPIIAYQILLSRNDVEPKILSEVLRALNDSVSNKDLDCWNGDDIANIINLIKKLRTRKLNMTGKDWRILQRDIMFFLGKHDGSYKSVRDTREDKLMVQLKRSSLALNILNPEEGVTYKINLWSILQMAVRDEDPYILQTLLTVISNELVKRKEACLQSALSLTFRALCRAHAQYELVDPVALHQALLLCDDLQPFSDIISYMSKERSPGVRRMLCDGLESVMLSDTGRDFTEQLITAVGEHALLMMDSSDPFTRKAGLHLTKTLAAVQSKNSTAVASLLPDILIKITKIYDEDAIDPFRSISNALMEQIELHSDERIKELTVNLLEGITVRPADRNHDTDRIYMVIVDSCLNFIKSIYDYKGWETRTVLEVCRGSCEVGWWYVFVGINRVFGSSDDIVSDVISGDGIIRGLRELRLHDDENTFVLETIVKALTEFADVLLKSEREKTLQFLADLTAKLTPNTITKISKTLIRCYNKYRDLCDGISEVDIGFENWWNNLSLRTVADDLNNRWPDEKTSNLVRSMKVMLKCFSKQTVDGKLVRDWPALVLQADRIVADTFYEDTLAVAIQFLTCEEVTKLLVVCMAHDEFSARRLPSTYMNVFFDYLLEESALDSLECPEILNSLECPEILNDVVKWCLEKASDESCIAVLKLVDKLWSAYETQATFEQKIGLLLDLGRLPRELDPTSAPLTWATKRLVEGGVSERIRLVGALPPGEAYSSAYKSFASLLPTRLRELSGESNAVLRALLDAAANGDLKLLSIVASLSAGDDSKGWWDEAIDSCMATLAIKSDKNIYDVAYKRCWEGLSTGVCDRLLVPLLRYATSPFCEEYLSGLLAELFGILEGVQKEPSAHYEYHKRVVDYTRALTIIQMAFEKIPHSLESPNTALYRSLNVQQMWYLVRQTCKLCVTLRNYVVCPPNADATLKLACRKFHCAAYTCLCAAICCRKPEAKFYDFVFNEKTWSSLVDRDHVYELRLRARSTVRKIRRAVGVDVTEAISSASSTGGSTVRTRVFLRTLTDNPLHYDRIPLESQTVKTQDIEMADNELNAHACAATLTALLAHASRLEHRKWLQTLCLTLTADSHTNVKYLLAQAICNNKVELSTHAVALREPLFQFIVQTARVVETKTSLNCLHVDVLDTLTSWRDDTTLNDTTYLNGAVDILISTTIDNTKNTDVHANLMQCLTRVLLVYGKSVTVRWSTLRPYFDDKPTEETKSCLSILMKITKQNIDISELLPTLLAKLESNDWIQTSKRWAQLKNLASLYGQASSGGGLYMDKYRMILDRIRRNDAMEYIKMLYYTQMECDVCCDLQNFKRITDLTRNVPRAERNKCLAILSSYLRRQSSADLNIHGMFDILNLDELIDDPIYSEGAMELVKSGLHLMSEELKSDLVQQIAGYCQHSNLKLRKAAVGVMLKAFQDIFPAQTNSNKRLRRDTTRIIDSISDEDGYIDIVMTSLALGITAKVDGEEGNSVCTELVKSLHADDMSIRFVECFIIAIYQPTMKSGSKIEPQPCVSITVLMEMLFAGLRGQELFKKLKLSNEPLEIRNENVDSSKLLTRSQGYRGTVRTYLSKKYQQRNTVKNTNTKTSGGIDVQMPVDAILEALLKFIKVNAEAAVSFCVEVVKAIRCNCGRGFDFDSAMSKLLAELMRRPNSLTPLVAELSRVFIETVSTIDGFQKSLENVKELTRGSESEGTIKLLLEEVKLRTNGNDYFVLGNHRSENFDVSMADSTRRFSMEELISTFGKLSNWDDMTLQEKRRIEPTIPKLWANVHVFATVLNEYTPGNNNNTWLDKMVSCIQDDDPVHNLRCLKELEKWPANHFAISAMTEYIEMNNPIQQELYQMDSQTQDQEIYPESMYVRPSDCMAEWAARLMIRRAVMKKRLGDITICDSDEACSHQLLWCSMANEKNLPRLALDWIESSGYAEPMALLIQKVKARRTLALRDNDQAALKNVLTKSVKSHWMYEDNSDSELNLEMKGLLMQLTSDVHDPEWKMNDLYKESKDCWHYLNSSKKVKSMGVWDSILDTVMSYYAELWKQSEPAERNNLFVAMTEVMGQAIDCNSGRCELFVAVVLHCLDNWSGISEEAARTVLQKLKNLPPLHPSVDDIRSHLHVFPPAVLSEFPELTSRPPSGGRSVDMYRKCFQLVADAGYSLTDYCEKLGRAINNNDRDEWKRTFDKMMEKIFGNDYAGDDYRVLNKYKNELYHIYDYEKTDANTKRQTLRNIVSKLDTTSPNVLRLSQLCPELTRRGLEDETCLSTLLGLPKGVNVVKFDERVRVMTGSVRRPCVLEARLSNGVLLRLLHKSGERLSGDACALRLGRTLARESPSRTHFTYYEVTPLGDDSGLIQYLEDHETLGAIISDSCNINQFVPGTADGELILQSMASSLQRYRKLCSNIPATALRSGIEKRSSCIQDFIVKKNKYLDSLAFMTILVWILGLGDRHLNNIMYSAVDGSVCSVDWSALMQYGNPVELAPARLTRNLLAVCDFQVIESRLQGVLGSIRESQVLLLPTIKVIFKSMGEEFNDKFQYIEGILRGQMLSHEISRDVIKNSNEKYRDKYLELFENVFGSCERKQTYSVEDQVSSLLQHCTDERILSVIRSNWEPWL